MGIKIGKEKIFASDLLMGYDGQEKIKIPSRIVRQKLGDEIEGLIPLKKHYFYINNTILIPRLQLLFDSLERERQQLLEKVNKLSQEQFHRSPPGKWSVSQILGHLIAAERLSLRYMNKKILGMQGTGNTGIAEEIKMALLKISQRLPFKFKAPGAVVEITPAYADISQLQADWEIERAELKAFLEKFKDSEIKRKIYRHIRAGRLNIQHALIFFREHHHHHLPQVVRLL